MHYKAEKCHRSQERLSHTNESESSLFEHDVQGTTQLAASLSIEMNMNQIKITGGGTSTRLPNCIGFLKPKVVQS